jgi:hypothetical protein
MRGFAKLFSKKSRDQERLSVKRNQKKKKKDFLKQR